MTATAMASGAMVTHRPARRRGGWLAVGLVVAVVLVGGGGLDVAGLLSHEPVQRHHRWTGVVTSVDVTVGNGSVTVVGSDRPGAVVTATGARGLNTPSDHETLTDGRLHITSGCSWVLGSEWCGLSYQLRVPKGVPVTVSAGSGSVHVGGVTGPMTLSSSDGAVDVDGGTGSLSLHSGDGNVVVMGARSQRVRATSGDGNVTIELDTVPAAVTATSSDGSVLVEVPPGPNAYQVDAHSNDGHASTTVRTAPTSAQHIDASSSDGDVTVRYLSNPDSG